MTALPTPNTRLDAVVRAVEDAVVVLAPALSTWQTGHNVTDVLIAAASAPVARSLLAGLLSRGRVSGLVLAVKLVWQALSAAEAQAKPAEPQPVPVELQGVELTPTVPVA